MKRVLGGAALALAAGASQAALDPSVATSLTGIQTDALALNGLVFPIFMIILGLTVTFKLVKRFASKF